MQSEPHILSHARMKLPLHTRPLRHCELPTLFNCWEITIDRQLIIHRYHCRYRPRWMPSCCMVQLFQMAMVRATILTLTIWWSVFHRSSRGREPIHLSSHRLWMKVCVRWNNSVSIPLHQSKTVTLRRWHVTSRHHVISQQRRRLINCKRGSVLDTQCDRCDVFLVILTNGKCV